MPYPDNLLSRGERVVLHKHPHWKVLVGPFLLFLLVIAGTSFGFAFSRSHTASWGIWWIVIGVAAVLILAFGCVAPFVRWRSEHFVITTRHVFFRTGFFQRREHQIPLGRIQNLEVNVTFWGRILGYGTLTIDSAVNQPLSFFNVASLPRVQGQLNQLIADDRENGGGLGDDPGSGQPPDGGVTSPEQPRQQNRGA